MALSLHEAQRDDLHARMAHVRLTHCDRQPLVPRFAQAKIAL